jgi:hypothetical protein
MPVSIRMASGGWSPLNIAAADRLFFFNAKQHCYNDAGSTLATDGQTVQQVNDLYGNYTVSQATSGDRPLWVSSGINSRPSLSWDGTDNNYLSVASVNVGGTTMSVFGIATLDSGANQYVRLVSMRENGNAADYDNNPSCIPWLRNATNEAATAWRASNAYGSQNITYGTAFRWGAVWDGTNFRSYLNGTASSNQATSLTFGTNMNLLIGCSERAVESWKGYLGTVFAFKRAPTAAELAAIDTYLRSY